MPPKKPRTPCVVCGKEPKRARYRYCSNACQMKFQRHEFLRKWRAGLASGDIAGVNVELSISKLVRQYLFEKYGNCCARCGWGERNTYTGKVPLQVEHLNGDSSDSREENLTLLCPNCHSLTATYGGADRGKGRGKRLRASSSAGGTHPY
jgi:hypothetical protein